MEDSHIPDESVIASSNLITRSKSRLFNRKIPHNAWKPDYSDKNAFLQIEIDKIDHVITAVASQGMGTYQSAVVKFQLSFSRDGLHWFEYKENGEVRVMI